MDTFQENTEEPIDDEGDDDDDDDRDVPVLPRGRSLETPRPPPQLFDRGQAGLVAAPVLMEIIGNQEKNPTKNKRA